MSKKSRQIAFVRVIRACFNPNGKIKIPKTHLKIFYFFNMNVNFATGNENELVDFVA